jgi:hypothetical protein
MRVGKKSRATTVSQYLDELPEERRPAWAKLRKLVRKIAPAWVVG